VNSAGRFYVLSATIVLAAMVDRVGWINWPALSHLALVGVTVLAAIAAVVFVAAVVVGLPMGLFMAVVLRLVPGKPAGEPPA
jgi:hypothetical protein